MTSCTPAAHLPPAAVALSLLSAVSIILELVAPETSICSALSDQIEPTSDAYLHAGNDQAHHQQVNLMNMKLIRQRATAPPFSGSCMRLGLLLVL